MADADLFMECEEEELEPWQQMNDDVEDEEVGVVENKANTTSISVVNPGTSSLTVVPPVATPVALPIVSAPLMVSSATIPNDVKKPMVSMFSSATSPVSSGLPPSMVPQAVPHTVPSLVSPGLPKPTPGQQLILTQSPAGLGTVAMPQVLQPMQVMPNPAPGPSAANNQPIFFTTQDLPPTHPQRPVGPAFPDQYNMGFPVRNVRPVQNSVNPLGIVLNVQQGQTVRPITLVSAPGTQFFKPAVGVPQVMPQPAPMQPGTQVAGRPPTSTYTTVQIPATLTIRSSTPLTQPLTTMAATTGTHPHPSAGPPPNQTPKIVNVCNLVTVKQGDGNPEVQKLVNLVNTVSPPTIAQPQTLQVVMANNKGPTNGLSTAAAASAPAPSPLDSIKVGPATSVATTNNTCPRCRAQFRMVEALRGHMCFCCPELTLNMKSPEGQKSMAANSAPVTRPALAPPIQPKPLSTPPSPQLVERGGCSGMDSQGKLIMLVDDFYYGTYEGIRNRASADLMREPMIFKCLSCAKKLKNNIRLMNHMKHHVELDQQNGEVDTHTNCQHCYRQFPTPFQLQCHLESVHSHYESTTKCKICEWAFESEPVFLQHMKNTHKPGEMPYVCQVCEYRSSFYSDVYNHFRTWHEDTRHLLCLYCLKVFKNSNSYQQHYIRHQKKTVYHCNKCRLQFLFTKDKIEHKVNHHKTFRKPRQLDGLMPGTKVTIRAYAAQNKAIVQPPVVPPIISSGTLPSSVSRNNLTPHMGEGHPKPSHANIQSQNKLQTLTKKRSVSKMLELLTNFQENRAPLGKQLCLECNFEVPDFPNHFPTYVHCSLCHYGTCCSRAYANHMINNHVPRRSHKYLAMYKRPAPSRVKLACTSCNFTSQTGDIMAKHLVQYRSHCYSLCTLKGSPKVGFMMERQVTSPNKISYSQPSLPRPVHNASPSSSKWEHAGQDEVLDHEMAPVEDMDTDTEEDQESCLVEEQEVQGTGNEKERDKLREQPKVSAPTADVKPMNDGLGGAKEREETLSVRQLRIVLFALCCGIPQAAEHFNTQTQLIHTWLQEKERQLDRERRSGGGEAVDRLVEWVLAQREQQLPVNEKNLFQKASEIHSQTNQSSSFRISYEWAVGFMLQHDLGLQTLGAMSRYLPRNTEENAQAFIEFVRKQIQAQNLSPSVIGAMDELSIFVDLDLLADPATPSKEHAFQLVGTGESLIDIFLAVLADGTLLPTMVFFKGQIPGRLRAGVPDSVLLEAKVEGFTEEEEMELWTSQVWQKHMKTRGGAKGMLIMDSFRSHMLDDTLATLSATSTLPTVVPAGCTCRLQPLEMCVRPLLQRFLQAHWNKLAAQGGAAGASPKDLVQLLVAWLVEALGSLSVQPELLQRSFHVAGVLPGPESGSTQADAQRELVSTLSEIMLGPDKAEPVPTAQESPGKAKEQGEKLEAKSDSESRAGKEEVEAKEDRGASKMEVKEAEEKLKVQEVENMNIDASKPGMV